MNSRQLTSVALKVFAIYVFVQTMLAIPSFFRLYIIAGEGAGYDNADRLLLITVFSVFLLVMLAIAIWKLSTNVVRNTTTVDNKPASALSEEFILSIVGLYLIFEGLTRFSFSSMSTYFNVISSTDSDDLLTQNMLYLVVYTIQIIIGLTLVVKSRAWASLLKRLREAGLNE